MTTEAGGVVALPPGAGAAMPGAGMGPGTELIVKAGRAETRGAYSLLEWRSAPGGAWVPPMSTRPKGRPGTCWKGRSPSASGSGPYRPRPAAASWCPAGPCTASPIRAAGLRATCSCSRPAGWSAASRTGRPPQGGRAGPARAGRPPRAQPTLRHGVRRDEPPCPSRGRARRPPSWRARGRRVRHRARGDPCGPTRR
jgi:hypothetical protein